MTSENDSFENPRNPTEPPLGSIGRSVADRWLIREMVLRFYASDCMREILARLNTRIDGIEHNIDDELENELGIANDYKYNIPRTRKDCEKRIRYLINEIKAMRKANLDKGE